MIITTRQFLSSLWIAIAILVATILVFALPSLVQAQQSIHIAGHASWYNLASHGTRTASGERYDHKAMTAAHPTLPFDTMVRVSVPETQAGIVVRINDRLAIDSQTMIALSGAAAKQLGLFDSGATEVNIMIIESQSLVGPAPGPPASRIEAEPEASAPITRVAEQVRNIRSSTYTLQIGLFTTRESAQKLASKYEKSWIVDVEQDGEMTYRVYYSRFEDEPPARSAQSELWADGQDSFLRKVIS